MSWRTARRRWRNSPASPHGPQHRLRHRHRTGASTAEPRRAGAVAPCGTGTKCHPPGSGSRPLLRSRRERPSSCGLYSTYGRPRAGFAEPWPAAAGQPDSRMWCGTAARRPRVSRDALAARRRLARPDRSLDAPFSLRALRLMWFPSAERP